MVKIGAVNIDTSHPKAFSGYFAKGGRARYTAVYNDGFRGADEVEAFIRKNSLEKRCGSIEELADCTDIGFIHSCNWDNHITQALPFINKGKPVFIDKPVAGSMPDLRKLEELAAGGAVILGSSSLRYARETAEFLDQPEESRGRIVNVFSSAGVDEFNYGIHAVEALCGLLDGKALSCRFGGRGEVTGKLCETYVVNFDNGNTAIYNTFTPIWQPHVLVVTTVKSTFAMNVDTSNLYASMLDKVCDYMETGVNTLASVGKLAEAVKIMLAGRLSKENGGAAVNLRDIPGDYEGFDGKAFEKEYAGAASKIYLE